MNGTVISFINLKGGVGKTSSAINIADKLAEKYKVLIVDMDPQFNATQSLLNHQLSHHFNFIPPELIKEVLNEFNSEYNNLSNEEGIVQENINEKNNEEEMLKSQMIYQKLKDSNITAKSLFSKDSIVNEIASPNLTYKIKKDLSLIPGDLDLFETLNGDTAGKHNILHDHIEEFNLREEYDYIIIDCPPNWTILTQSSLFASDYYIIPSKVDLFSSIGINLLENLVNNTFYKKNSHLYSTYQLFREKSNRKTLKPLGILFTLTHNMVISDRVKNELKDGITGIDFFDSEIPYHSSVPMKFSMYTEIGEKHKSLTNAIDKVVAEIYTKIDIDKEGENLDG
ncbi:ParA family protein [Staphylococcus equorum]|uniref:ParA family protein n=1 Tax=Staphylococcus equorum TaxID=246432 RepID=UPI0025561A64|nr:AAA family ATPase [Staphylococcus equorum]MDK9857686.1 AAA family ATPase [Staphylococcus equorum]MDK9874746.1 AAA family ATPase [Staphylococcus equorum]